MCDGLMDSEMKPENYGTIWSQPQKQKGLHRGKPLI
jgi:hypothetical protein